MIRGVRPTYRHVFAVLAVVASVYFGVRTSDAIVANRALASQLNGAQGAVATLERQNAALGVQLAYEQTPAYAEQVARTELGLMKPGDHVVHVALSSPPTSPAAPVDNSPAKAAPAQGARMAIWRRWLQVFTNPSQSAPLRTAP